jgi:hypothetical protein
LAYVVNTRRWLSDSSVEAWNKVNTIVITAAKNAIDPTLRMQRTLELRLELRLKIDSIYPIYIHKVVHSRTS